MPERLRLAVELAAWCELRRGEILGLQRGDIDTVTGAIRIERSLGELRKDQGGVVLGPPKTAAGRRTIHAPETLLRSLFITWSST